MSILSSARQRQLEGPGCMLSEKIGFVLCNPFLWPKPLADHQLSVRRCTFAPRSTLPGDRHVSVWHEAFDAVGEAGHESSPPKLSVHINLLARRLLRAQGSKDRLI